MKTPIQELIKQLEDLRDSISEDDAMYRGGVINSIRLAESMLEREEKEELKSEIIDALLDSIDSDNQVSITYFSILLDELLEQ